MFGDTASGNICVVPGVGYWGCIWNKPLSGFTGVRSLSPSLNCCVELLELELELPESDEVVGVEAAGAGVLDPLPEPPEPPELELLSLDVGNKGLINESLPFDESPDEADEPEELDESDELDELDESSASTAVCPPRASNSAVLKTTPVFPDFLE